MAIKSAGIQNFIHDLTADDTISSPLPGFGPDHKGICRTAARPHI
jgi:hypothetical protein